VAGKNPSSKLPAVMWCALAALLVMAGTAFLIVQVPTLRNFVLKISSDGVHAEFQNDGQIDDELTRWASKGTTLAALQAWLFKNFDRLDPDGSRLRNHLVHRCPQPRDNGISAYQQRIAECDRDPILRPLRELSEDRDPPFQRGAVKVRVGMPKKGPPKGVAYTCYNGRLEHKRVRLLLPEIPHQLEVQVRGGFACDPGKVFPDLQINAAQAHRLLGRPTREIEEVFALII